MPVVNPGRWPAVRPARLAMLVRLAALVVVAVALMTSCQWLQNEFFFLDTARPPLPAEPDPAAFGQ